MRKNNVNAIIGILALIPGFVFAQDSTKKELLLSMAYHMAANKVPQLLINTKN